MPADSLFDQALKAEGVTGKLADLARSIYSQESGGGRNTKTSNADARGGMQILPATFNSVADAGWDIADPLQNARGGIRYLKQLDKQAGGDPSLTAVGYYGGPGGMEKARRGIAVADPRNPNAPNTLQYASQVLGRMGQGGASPAAPVAAPAVVDAPMTVAVAAPAIAPVLPSGGSGAADDPWQRFVRSVPQQRQMAPQDLNYGPAGTGAQGAPVQLALAPVNTRPNFEAFGGWRGRG